MIIITQDKKAIHNFDNVLSIQVEGEQIIIYDEINDSSALGTYETEERAIEVLNEIIKRIVMTERFATICIPERQDNMVMSSYDNDEPLFIYQMPKE